MGAEYGWIQVQSIGGYGCLLRIYLLAGCFLEEVLVGLPEGIQETFLYQFVQIFRAL